MGFAGNVEPCFITSMDVASFVWSRNYNLFREDRVGPWLFTTFLRMATTNDLLIITGSGVLSTGAAMLPM